MNPCTCLRRLDFFAITVGFALSSAAFSQSSYAGKLQEQQTSQAQQQASQPQQNPQPSPPPQDPSARKPKKVWTNDDVISLRSPADTYRAEKEAQEAADTEAAAKKAQVAKQINEAGLTIKLPSTPEETKQLIKEKEERIRDLQQRLDRLNLALRDAPESQKVTMQKLIEAFTSDSQKAQLELRVLQQHLQNLAKTALSEPPAASPSPENP